MADRIQQRRDTAARWAQYNPVLLEGEVGYVTDNPNQYKIGDGIHAWNDLPLRGYTGTIVQTTGNDENSVMSQKSISNALGIKTILFPQYSIVNIDLINKKVIISEGQFYYSNFNKNSNAFAVEIPQEIDISDKLAANSALLFDTNNRTFVFYNHTEQNAITDDMAIIALLNGTNIYYVSCDILVNGERFGPINAQNQVKDILSKVDVASLKLFQDNVDYNTLPIIGFSDLSITLNTTTKEFTYGSFNVFYGKTKYAYQVPAGSGTYVNGGQNVLRGLNTIFFNISTKEVAWSTFERYSDYIGKDNKNWIVLEHFANTTPVIGFIHAKKSDGTWLSVSDSLGDRLTSVSDSLGDFWGNMVTGSDLVIGYNDSDWNLNALSVEGVNAGIVREFSTEISKYVFKATVRSGSNVTASYWKATIRSFAVNIPQGQKFYVGVRYKVNKSSSSVPLSLEVLGNGTWLNGLGRKDRFCLIIDGKWHYKTFEVSLDSNDITKIEFVIFLSGRTSYTYSEDCSIEFTDLLLSMTKCPEYSLPKGENDYLVLGEYNNIQSLKSNGILWSNLFAGSDMEKGYNQDNILAFSTYPSLGGTVERVLDNETSRYCIKAHFPTGTEFTSDNNFVYPSLMKNISFTGEDTTQEFSVSFRYKCSPNFKGFCPLCNGGWMQYLKNDGTWGNMRATTIPLVKDNNWHYAHIVTRKTDVSNKTYSVGLYAYFATGSAVTLEEDLDFCITDIVISPSRFPDYSVVRNVNDYLSSVDKETLQPIVNEIIKEYPDAHGCVFMSLGDSITTESYYIPKLRQLLAPSKYYNLAVASATWADRSGTTSYDGNPLLGGDANQNVLGNQVQKIINNPETYNVAPDIIIIAAGTNDGTPISADKSDYEMRVDIDSHFNENQTTPIQVTEPTFDDSDTYMSHRKTIAGAMRYCVLKLQSMYPKARIYILTPIQGSYNPNKDYLTAQEVKQRYISEVAKHLAVPVIHVGEECGINRDFEYGGTYWKEEWADENHPKQGRDLIDGLHPNTSGGWKMAKYIAKKLINDFVNQDY